MNDLLMKTKLAGAAIIKYRILKFGSDDNHVIQAAGASDSLIGASDVVGAANAEDQVDFMTDGIAEIEFGGSVTRDQSVTSDANGKAVAAVAGDNIIGKAFGSYVNGDVGLVHLEGNLTQVAQTADGNHAKQIAKATFDATGGKAAAAHGLGVSLPDNAIVTRAWYEVLTTFTSSGDNATIQLGIPTDDAAGIKAAVAIDDGGNPWDAGLHEGIQDGAASNFSTKTTASRELTATVAVEALTAGKLILFCEYVVTG
jgi:hypothetical protein